MMTRGQQGRMKAAPLSVRRIRRLVQVLKKVMGIKRDLYIDIVAVLEHKITILDPDFYFEIIPDDRMKDMALTYPDQSKMEIKESVYNGAIAGFGRDRMTIAHEIGHFLLHDSSRIRFARTECDNNLYEDPEWQASCFGGEMLVDHELIENLSDVEISDKCGVSMEAARYIKKWR